MCISNTTAHGTDKLAQETAFTSKEMFELNYIYHTRWISSEFQSVQRLKKMWNICDRPDENSFMHEEIVENIYENPSSEFLFYIYGLEGFQKF